ncbi:MAG: hypothetical protein AB1349_09220 [Elusimicrobiota bacterium]
MSKVIDTNTGDIYIEKPLFRVTKKLSRNEFRNSPLFKNGKIIVDEEPYFIYWMSSIIDSQSLSTAFCFYKQNLWTIGLCHPLTDEGCWENWSEKRELARKNWHDDWLKTVMPDISPKKIKWKKTKNIELGGLLHPNKEHLKFAIRKIEFEEKGFPTLELAREYARRWVRSWVE